MLKIGFTSGGDLTAMSSILRASDLQTYEYGAGRGAVPNSYVMREFSQSEYKFSIHSPYYMSMTNKDKIENNINMVKKYCEVATKMNVDRIIIHAGNLQTGDRKYAESIAYETFKQCVFVANKYNVTLCPETVGKYKTYGNYTEVIRLCKNIPELLPCFDIGHMNAVTGGFFNKFKKVHWIKFLNVLEDSIGTERAKQTHWHVSKVAYNNNNEVKHLCLDDEGEPDFRPLIEALTELDYNSRLICESAVNTREDAIRIRDYYKQCLQRGKINGSKQR
jgi:deoxyribonuclease-4